MYKLALVFSAIALIAHVYYYSTVDNIKSEHVEDALHNHYFTLHPNVHHAYSFIVLAIGLTMIPQGAFSLVLLRASVFFIIRAVMVSLTSIHPVDKQKSCKNTLKTSEKLMSLGGCRDHIPSGHSGAVFIVLFSLFSMGVLPMGAVIPIAIGQVLVPTLTRQHYTIDPIVSLFIAIVIVQNLA